MAYRSTLLGHTYTFSSVKEVLAKANEQKSGDMLAGLAASSELERVAAKEALSRMTLETLRQNPAVPYEEDEVTRMNQDSINEVVYEGIKNLTVAEFREWILDYQTAEKDLRRVSKGLTAEMVAGVTKLMNNLDLVYAASKIRVPARCNTTIGLRGTMATRLQPNHTTDDVDGITASVLEGLSYGCGDALIGLNPVNDTASSLSEVLKRLEEIKQRFDVPTQICVLGHITTQIEAVRQGAPTDLIFQSVAGSEKGNKAFGFCADTVREAWELLKRRGSSAAPNIMYFETGQGSELSSESHHGTDQVTMEARCYAFAREFSPFMVNTVVGFIGPEYLYDSRQVIRAGLEDHFMGKLSGIPMGCDCCYTNHMMADQNDVENLSVLLASAGVNYILAIPASDDIMLNYQSNSFHDASTIRETLRLRPVKEFEVWLEKMGLMEDGRLTKWAGDPTFFLKKDEIGENPRRRDGS
jgi:ethanolamine ammonia-lyase large subunit